MSRPSIIAIALLLVSGSAAADSQRLPGAQPPMSSVAGTVSVTGPDGEALVLPGVTLTVTCVGSDAPLIEGSNEQGQFRFADVPVGSCSIVAELQGFKSAT